MNAAQFNTRHPIGTPVFAYTGFRPEDDANARRLVTRTRTEAQSVGLDRTGVVWVDGHGAYIALSHIDVVTEDDWAAAKEADAEAAAENAATEMASRIERLRRELDGYKEQLDFLERTTLPELQRTIQHHKDGKQRWRERAEKAEARVRELERPAVEAERNEIRQSYADLVAAAEGTKDYEGAFDFQCRLRDREEQWARDDQEAAR
ncbi:MAG: hypothetical protein HOZ81_20095 [Streptomyces sp.]|nr:hypothetical protein [Streptomyces sp.]NUS81843.1 hypothetical protein [Streptomyces sp.]